MSYLLTQKNAGGITEISPKNFFYSEDKFEMSFSLYFHLQIFNLVVSFSCKVALERLNSS